MSLAITCLLVLGEMKVFFIFSFSYVVELYLTILFCLLIQYVTFKRYQQIDPARLVLKNEIYYVFSTQHNYVAVIIVRSVLLHQNA